MREKNAISKELIEALNMMLDGQEEGFNIVYRETYNYVWNRCRIIMGKDNDAMELLQEVYIAFYKSIDKLNDANTIFGWLKTACYYQHTMLLRKKKEVLLSEEAEGLFDIQETADTSVLPGVELELKETIDIIKGVIEELSEEQRAVVTAYYYDEMSVKEIAESLNVSDGTVKSRLNYARKHIKEAIEDKEKQMGIKLHSTSVPALILAIRSMIQGYTVSGAVMESSYVVIGSSLGFAAEVTNIASQVAGVSSVLTSETERVVVEARKEVGKNVLKGMVGKAAATKIVVSIAVLVALVIGGAYVASQQEEKDSNTGMVMVAEEQNDMAVQVNETEEETSELADNIRKHNDEEVCSEEEWIRRYYPILEEYKEEYILRQSTADDSLYWNSSNGYEFRIATQYYALYDMNKDSVPELVLGYGENSTIGDYERYDGLYLVYSVFTWENNEIIQILGKNEKWLGNKDRDVYLCENNSVIWLQQEMDVQTGDTHLLLQSKEFEIGSYDFTPTDNVELSIYQDPYDWDLWREKVDNYFSEHKLIKLEWVSIFDWEESKQESVLHTIDEHGNVTQCSEDGAQEWTTNVYEIFCDNKLIWSDRRGGDILEDVTLEVFPSLVANCKIYQEEYVRVHIFYGGAGWCGWNDIYLDPETGAFVKKE